MGGPFTLEDLTVVSAMVIEAWSNGLDQDWAQPAGTLEWSCLRTADHTVDCMFSYAFFLASGKQDGYPNFGELHALAGATPFDLIEGLRAVTSMLRSVILTAAPEARAIIWRTPSVRVGRPADFAARGALELILHGHDVASGLGRPLTPSPDLCARLLSSTTEYPGGHQFEYTHDPCRISWPARAARGPDRPGPGPLLH